MRIDRRSLFRAALGGVSALVLPPTVEANAEDVRRFTVQLDRTHLGPAPMTWHVQAGVRRPNDWFDGGVARNQVVQVRARGSSSSYRFRSRASPMGVWSDWVSAEMVATPGYELGLETPVRFEAGVLYECQVQTNLNPVDVAFQSMVPANIHRIGWRV